MLNLMKSLVQKFARELMGGASAASVSRISPASRRSNASCMFSCMFSCTLSCIGASMAWDGVAAADGVSFEMANIGNPNNPADPATGFGRVERSFAISKRSVSIAEYVTFLNAVAKDDRHGLYNPRMATDPMTAGIRRDGAPGNYVYDAIEPSGQIQSAAATAGGRPVTYVSWFDTARFANWMSNGQPTGPQNGRTTENGAYDLREDDDSECEGEDSDSESQAVRVNAINPNTRMKPRFYIPTENEWYKAAYYNPELNGGAGGYTLYATKSNSNPGNIVGSAANQSNYISAGLFGLTQELSLDLNLNYLTNVGAFTSTPGPYGTYDMNGSVWELTDMDGSASVLRTIRGGGWTSYFTYLQSDYRLGSIAAGVSNNVGFRLAASNAHSSTINYQLRRIGNPRNKADRTGFGRVRQTFWIGTYEVTIRQYCDFLNAVASQEDTYGLYDPAMFFVKNCAGIAQSGSPGAYTYTPLNNAGDSSQRPITYVSWFDVARFANWMSNGQPVGPQSLTTTEDGAYRLNGAVSGLAVPRNHVNPNAGGAPTFYLPTEDQWYKAAYYSPALNDGRGGYYRYATASDTAPSNRVGGEANMVNFIDDYSGTYFYSLPQARYIKLDQNYLFDVGAYTASLSYYGTFDQSGNAYNWNDLDGRASPLRGLRGGFFFAGPPSIQSTTFSQATPGREEADTGFRLASPG